jgi:phosphoglycerate dehydrogenase-like enzyme
VSATIEIVSLVDLPDETTAQVLRRCPGAHLTIAAGAFDDELRASYGDVVGRRFLSRRSPAPISHAEGVELLRHADAIVVGFPVPVDLRARSPRLRWVHHMRAGASNLRHCDVWGSDVVVTTSRGLGNSLAIAEYVVAAFLHFARGIHQASLDRLGGQFDAARYESRQLAGTTVCVVGAGGIGQQVGRLCAALGMRVVGTRRSSSANPPPGFDEVRGPAGLVELVAEADFVAVCCQLTPETEGMIGHAALAALPDGAVLVNVARGEILDEDALLEALAAGRLRGVVLDVYQGEFERQPPAALLADPRVLITPHVSAASDQPWPGPIELLCENVAAFVERRVLRNAIDWDRGY